VGLGLSGGKKSCVRFHYMVRGSAWLSVDNTEQPDVALSGGDLAVLLHVTTGLTVPIEVRVA